MFGSDEEFTLKLRESLEKWQADGTRAVWVKVAIEHSSLVPHVTQLDFHFHHAQKDYVMLKKWLATGEPDNTPDYAGQYLGCAGFVVNSRNEVLVVQEKYHMRKHWKLPGGHADPGEEIGEAAAREVFEETGVSSNFQCVMCFRHQHNYKFGCSDFYFVCLMTPTTENIARGTNEISDCRWMDIEELLNHPDTTQLNRHIVETYLQLKQQGQYTLAPCRVYAPFDNHPGTLMDQQSSKIHHKYHPHPRRTSAVSGRLLQLVYSVQPCVIDSSSKQVSVLNNNIKNRKHEDYHCFANLINMASLSSSSSSSSSSASSSVSNIASHLGAKEEEDLLDEGLVMRNDSDNNFMLGENDSDSNLILRNNDSDSNLMLTSNDSDSNLMLTSNDSDSNLVLRANDSGNNLLLLSDDSGNDLPQVFDGLKLKNNDSETDLDSKLQYEQSSD